ncbi:MAG: C-GCAxxG-C-C family (seleno)protein [Spirochaetota bacterium]
MKYSRLVADDYMIRNDYNCAEAMLHAANEAYSIGLSEKAMGAASAFGGGMGCGGACGALTGSLMALGVMRSGGKQHQDPHFGALRDEVVQKFTERFGSTECSCVKANHRDAVRGCSPVTEGAAEILEEVLGD